jgi:ADP-heptose:LPS heptosyltransferase
MVRGVDQAIPIDPRGSVSELLRTIRRLREAGYDAAVDLQGLIKSAVLARAAGARRTIGFPRDHLREPIARAFYTETPDPGRGADVIAKNLGVMRALGVEDLHVTFPLNVPTTRAGDNAAAAFGPDGYAVIHPGAAWPNKRWPAGRFGAVAAAIRARIGVRSLVLWGPGEESLASVVAAASKGAADVSPRTSIVDLFAIARGAKLMIAGDTGPLHVAASVGTPIVGLFGPTLAERSAPYGRADIALSRTSRCCCRDERRCRLQQPCIEDIGVDEVVAAVERRLAPGTIGDS